MTGALRRSDGYVMPDHYPGVLGDTPDNDLARAWCLGYLRALIQSTAPTAAG